MRMGLRGGRGGATLFRHICSHNHKYLDRISREAAPDTPAQSEPDVIAVFAPCNGGGDCAKIFSPGADL